MSQQQSLTSSLDGAAHESKGSNSDITEAATIARDLEALRLSDDSTYWNQDLKRLYIYPSSNFHRDDIPSDCQEIVVKLEFRAWMMNARVWARCTVPRVTVVVSEIRYIDGLVNFPPGTQATYAMAPDYVRHPLPALDRPYMAMTLQKKSESQVDRLIMFQSHVSMLSFDSLYPSVSGVGCYHVPRSELITERGDTERDLSSIIAESEELAQRIRDDLYDEKEREINGEAVDPFDSVD